MADYMASLDRLIERGDSLLLPGHGGPVTAPRGFMRGLKTHRKMRERAILERIRGGDRTIKAMVAAIYRDTDPRLHGAAGLPCLRIWKTWWRAALSSPMATRPSTAFSGRRCRHYSAGAAPTWPATSWSSSPRNSTMRAALSPRSYWP